MEAGGQTREVEVQGKPGKVAQPLVIDPPSSVTKKKVV